MATQVEVSDRGVSRTCIHVRTHVHVLPNHIRRIHTQHTRTTRHTHIHARKRARTHTHTRSHSAVWLPRIDASSPLGRAATATADLGSNLPRSHSHAHTHAHPRVRASSARTHTRMSAVTDGYPPLFPVAVAPAAANLHPDPPRVQQLPEPCSRRTPVVGGASAPATPSLRPCACASRSGRAGRAGKGRWG